MIVDSSALVAILKNEPEAEAFIGRLALAMRASERAAISAANLFEFMLVIDGLKDPILSRQVEELLAIFDLVVIDVSRDDAERAREANRLYGRKFHSARLNFGDCFAYALAKRSGEPLLFKGKDFPQTDVISAI